MIRDWTNSEKVDVLSSQAEVFFTRLIMKVDDYGCFWADTRLLKANLFPLKLDKVREADLIRWMAECQKAGLVVLYESDQKKYLQIHDFRQRLDRAKAKFPLPPNNQNGSELREVVNDFPPEAETNLEQKQKPNRAKALVVAGDDPTAIQRELKGKYSDLVTALKGFDVKAVWTGIKEFIATSKPQFIEPYIDAWNLFSSTYKLSNVDTVSDSRKKKLNTRLCESSFDFVRVLEKIKTSGHLKGDNQRGWKVNFDWIIENDKNYLKIIEGHYD